MRRAYRQWFDCYTKCVICNKWFKNKHHTINNRYKKQFCSLTCGAINTNRRRIYKPWKWDINKRVWKDEDWYCLDCKKKLYKPTATRCYSCNNKYLWKIGKGRKLKGSKVEDNFAKYLEELGIKYERQFKLNSRRYDFYLPKFKLLIEIDGNFFHCNPKIYSAPIYDIQKVAIANDKLKNDIASKSGYRLVRVWENEIKTCWRIMR